MAFIAINPTKVEEVSFAISTLDIVVSNVILEGSPNALGCPKDCVGP